MDTRINSVFWTLRIAFGLTAFLAGFDKFFNLLTNWVQYLNPMLLNVVPFSASTMMQIVGVIEMIAGIVVLAGYTRLGGYVITAWLTLIALTLITSGRFFDVAVRDLVMAASAFSLARISEARDAVFSTNARMRTANASA